MLLPDKTTIERLLHHYRVQERVVLSKPHDLAVRRRFEDTAYTLCVLMGERTAREAVYAAERYLGKGRPVGRLAPNAPQATTGGPPPTPPTPLTGRKGR
ncbi:DUF5133 domain-containing protein [Streptomyces purpureus]|uniref:DUF5133 domain-containing protein n=1 Tax=Streptomyces purpureus TaxID=1951 RepID=A0A918LNV2_9ACTN|nr:DUF5133 domain-containing protein [Streptomyces purpureus]GGT29371.1 hypothetical protein GCM10014713_23640 [Streptomyces purpureus]